MEKEIIDALREYYELPEYVTNEQISNDLNGFFGEAIIRIGIAKQNFKKSVTDAFKNIFTNKRKI